MNSRRLLIVLISALVGAGAGTVWQILPIARRPQEFRSAARVIVGGTIVYGFNSSPEWQEQREDFYGTIIETIQAPEMKHRALDRMEALHPDLQPSAVEIRATHMKGSTLLNILAAGTEPKYTQIFLDALLDEHAAYHDGIREHVPVKIFQQLLKEVASRQKLMEEALVRLEITRKKADTVEAKTEQERRAARLIRLRDQRANLALQLKASGAEEAVTLAPIEKEIKAIEAALQIYEAAAAELRLAEHAYRVAQISHEKLFEKVEAINQAYESNNDYVAILERATPATEYREDWRLPVAVGASFGGLLGALIGFLPSLFSCMSRSHRG